jgi:mRNA-degrading endonuclease toxin of MazEF toxin-antitoxin module
LDDCPPLQGDVPKRRPVVVITPTQVAGTADELIVVACTSTILPSDTEAIELPDRGRTPQTHSGLTRRTWAVPRWWLPVPRERLTNYAGFIRGELLRRVVAAVVAHMEQS